MPRVKWGINSGVIDDFDRESQYKLYTGPIPPNGVYEWRISTLKFVAGTKDKFPQLRVGLELVPRRGRKEERAYKGYFVMAFLPIAENTQFRYVPFLDAIGVSGHEFINGTITDEDGNIRKIGRWKNSGEEMIAAQLIEKPDQNNNLQKQIGLFAELSDSDELEDDELDDNDFDEDDDEYDE